MLAILVPTAIRESSKKQLLGLHDHSTVEASHLLGGHLFLLSSSSSSLF